MFGGRVIERTKVPKVPKHVREREQVLTKEFLEELFEYDRENGLLFWKKILKQNKSKLKGKKAGTFTPYDYSRIMIGGQRFLCHRIIWFLENGDWPAQIDHINGVSTDNRIVNLRASTSRLNNQNRINHRNGKLAGATKIKDDCWRANCRFDGENIYIGMYDTEKDAHIAYLTKLVELFEKKMSSVAFE